MPGFSVRPQSIVNQIKSNLQDRYRSGYPILKELLQNADDARAKRFLLHAREGWPDAANPLLRAAGVLVVNDGVFRPEDEDGIVSFGDSSKSTDGSTIGKFGFGQKAVFHLCDAFVVYARRAEKPFSTVVNPFLRVAFDGNVTSHWEPPEGGRLPSEDEAIFDSELAKDFDGACLALWLPLRTAVLRPGPDVGFSPDTPTTRQVVEAVTREDDLRLLLSALRCLEALEIREDGVTRCKFQIEAHERLLGPEKCESPRFFHGKIITDAEAIATDFVGRETLQADEELEALRRDRHWPTTISALSSTAEQEKGAAHGAAVLMRRPGRTPALRISWAVFLPISESADVTVALNGEGLGEYRLLLHGYFFLDSGRREIEGLTAPFSGAGPEDGAALRRAWNTALRDRVVLPLLPACFLGAFRKALMSSAELARLVESLAGSDWFRENRAAICRETVLLRALEGANAVVWRIESTSKPLRPLPGAVADAPARVMELLPDIHNLARERGALLCIGEAAALTAGPLHWPGSDLGELLAGLTPRAFQSDQLASLLADFLSVAVTGLEARRAVGAHLIKALRQALTESAPLARLGHIEAILTFAPQELTVPLPFSVEHRDIFRALAEAPAAVLPVRREWLGGADGPDDIDDKDLDLLLGALEPLCDGKTADQAAVAGLALLKKTRRPDGFSKDAIYAHRRIVRARDPRDGSRIIVSLQVLFERARFGLLFGPSPDANAVLPALARALPEAEPLILDNEAAKFLREEGGDLIRLQSATKDRFFELIDNATHFGPARERASFLSILMSLGGADQQPALRRLCAGARAAGSPQARVWETRLHGLERVLMILFEAEGRDFLIPSEILDSLTRNQLVSLGVRSFGETELEELLNRCSGLIGALDLSTEEREALICAPLSIHLRRRLPIHERSDGTIGDAVDAFFEEARWPMPTTLQDCALRLIPARNSAARLAQQTICRPWTPLAQIEVILAQSEPHHWRHEMLDAVEALSDTGDPVLQERLAATEWLFGDGRAVAPKDILLLPPDVDAASRALLGERAAFLALGALAPDLREHAGFATLKDWGVLPDQAASFRALSEIVGRSQIPGRLGSGENLRAADLRALAREDLKLPGWPLLAAAVNVAEDSVTEPLVLALEEVGPEGAEMAAAYLDALAGRAERAGNMGEAARRAFRAGFEAVAKWPEDARRSVFAAIRVPTAAGVWRSGREVIESGEGVAPASLLARDYAALLPRLDCLHDNIIGGSAMGSRPPRGDGAKPATIVDLAALDAQCVQQQRSFLKGWRERAPAELVVTYLGLIGRGAQFVALAREWEIDAQRIETLWADLDHHFAPPVLHNTSLRAEIESRRFRLEPIEGQCVRARALSGDIFEAHLSGAGGLLVGNLHKTPQPIRAGDRVLDLFRLQIQAPDFEGDPRQIFRDFVRVIAEDCLGLIMSRQTEALEHVFNKVDRIDQATLEETERLLQDYLPVILGQLKLPESRAREALRAYQAEEEKLIRLGATAQEICEAKARLWREVQGDELARIATLHALRSKIHDFGYASEGVLFELLQNADDAYGQLADAPEVPCFRLVFTKDGYGGVVAVHWGRPINGLGTDPEVGRTRGYGRDLLNMLLLNFSEKRSSDGLVGKFGLGFKTVHTLSDNVGIASGFLALRIAGGFLPEAWPGGAEKVEAHRLDGRKATLIDIPFSPETQVKGIEATDAFLGAISWLPAFTRHIRDIEVEADGVTRCLRCRESPLDTGLTVLRIEEVGAAPLRALRLSLCGADSLLILLDDVGPCTFPLELSRLWNLAPLKEPLRAAWLLNASFEVDPGRGRLAGLDADQRATFARLGDTLGARLARLHELASDWSSFAARLGLSRLDGDREEEDARRRFWSRLFDVFASDFDERLAAHLHIQGRGYARLAGQPTTPNDLSEPFTGLLRARDAAHFVEGSLAQAMPKMADWGVLRRLKGCLVSALVADRLLALGVADPKPLTLAACLREEMGPEKHITPELAARLGRVVSIEAIESRELEKELYDVAREALFQSRGGSWRSVQQLSCEDTDNEDERLWSDFAADSDLLDVDAYEGAALTFFKVARAYSGFGPQVRVLLHWALDANNPERQRAVLRYLLEGGQREALAAEVRRKCPAWLPWPIARLHQHDLLAEWSDDDRRRLVYFLQGPDVFNLKEAESDDAIDPGEILSRIHEWWTEEREGQRETYENQLYPQNVTAAALRNGDREAWFTFFALACFQSLGRTKDGQRLGFIRRGLSEGWWPELAASRPPAEFDVWRARLEAWSDPAAQDQEFLLWRRAFVELYAFARGLEDYREILVKLPRIIAEEGLVSLDLSLRPGEFHPAARLGLEAAPINRSLGVGMNWMIREMVRLKIYGDADAARMAPYCWGATQRLRNLLNILGAGLDQNAAKDQSPRIYDFVRKHLTDDRARFDGDFDLPIQLITTSPHKWLLEHWASNAGLDPTFLSGWEDADTMEEA